jgi:methionyl-tRNA formyltransferase
MRLVFAGTPDVAVASLDALVGSRHDVAAVLTRPPARAGRGREPRRSAVHEAADRHGIPVLTPEDLRDPQVIGELRAIAPDCCPVVAYGVLIPAAALSVPSHGWVNLHFSLLPRWRGAAPVQHAIWSGDDVTGSTTFRIDEGLDTGPILRTVTTSIGDRETSGDVLGRLAVDGAALLVATMDAIESGSALSHPQPFDGVTFAPRINVEDARIDWTRPATDIDRLIRACTPAPGAWTTFRDQRVLLGPVEICDVTETSQESDRAGTLHASKSEVRVSTGTTALRLGEVIPQGRRPMAAADWSRGLRLGPGEALE